MRRIYIILTLMALLLVSCEFERDQMGYPKSIYFPADGGTQIFKGNNRNFTNIEIEDDDANGYISPDIEDTLVAEHDWLTVKYKKHSDSIIVSAKPNLIQKKRKLWIYPYWGTKYVQIKVTQGGL